MEVKSIESKTNFLRGFPIFTLSLSKYMSSKKRNYITIFILSIPILLSILLTIGRNYYWTSYTLTIETISLTYIFYISFGVIIILFFATFLTSDEISDKTITYLLHSPISREELFLWKLLSYLVFSLSLFLILEVLFFIIFSIPHLEVLNKSNIDTFIGLMQITVVNISLYGSFFFLTSVATDRPIIYGLLVGFADQILLGTIFPNLLGAYSLSYHIKAIGFDMFGRVGPFSGFTGTMRIQDSYLVVVGLLLALNCLSLLVARRKEYI